MRIRSIVLGAVAASVLASASLSQAAFTISALPSAQSAPAGRFAYDLFAQNDAGGPDGSNLQAIKMTLTGLNGTKMFFATFDPGDGTIGVDQWNFGAAAQSNTILDLGSSNLRFSNKALNTHTFTNFPGDSDSPITADQAANGLSSFSADYALLSAAQSVPTPTAPGARFARLVFNTPSPLVTATFNVAGETGAGVDYTYTPGFFPPPPNVPPIGISAPTPVVFGSAVSNGAPFSVTVSATDAEVPLQTLTLAIGALPAGITNVAVSPANGGTSPVVFTVTGTVAYSLNQSTVLIPYTLADGAGGTFSGQITLIVTPEPAMMMAVASVSAAALIRRRK
jgi:hypothetical protein